MKEGAVGITPGHGPTPNGLNESPLLGTSSAKAGVTGESNTGPGVWGQSLGLVPPVLDGGKVSGLVLPGSDGVLGQGMTGVHGIGNAASGQAAPTKGAGVFGDSDVGIGACGLSKDGVGVYGASTSSHGVAGETSSATSFGVSGANNASGTAVSGSSSGGIGVAGNSTNGTGVMATGGAFGIVASANASGTAGWFKGNVGVDNNLNVTGNITVGQDVILQNQDCAEDFDVSVEAELEAGSVVVIDGQGAITECACGYDKRVAGVVSGAGDFKPGIILGRTTTRTTRRPVALVGKTYCKVDASYAPIETGDLLTTSPTPGHAMKAADPLKAFGAVIGKALRPLREGQGLIPILVALQ
jgi:hypothetical protein